MAICKKLEAQVDLLALTCGRDGLYLHRRHHPTIHANVEIAKVISAVGSGDCLTAGIAFALGNTLGNKLSHEELARWGVASGAANCIRPELGMLHLRDVQELLGKVQINSSL